MKALYSCLTHDLRAGRSSLLCSVGLGFLMSLMVSVGFWTKARLFGIDPLNLSLGDYLTNYLAGVIAQGLNLTGGGGKPFYLPATWMLTMLLPCYATLWYPRKDLESEGAQILLRAGSRMAWWLAKCAWVALAVSAYWVAGYACQCVFAQMSGATLNIGITGSLSRLLALGEGSIDVWGQSVAPMMPTVVAVSVSLALAEHAADNWCSPAWGFCLVAALLFLSALLPESALIGNFLMAVRSSSIVAGGASPVVGVCFSVAITVVALLVGSVSFRQGDILVRGDR